MRERENYNQLEMFSETGKPYRQDDESHNIFACCLRGHEKIVILIISFIITGVISFSFGVEHGKKISLFKTRDMRIEIADTKTQGASIQQQKRIFKNNDPVQTNNENGIDSSSEKISRYTIQLASYKTSTTAQREAQKLQGKGHTTLIITKGNYIILCVGNFADKKVAKTKLSELKKEYRDGIIRRL